MGCCFSKKRRAVGTVASARRCEPDDRSPPSPEEETVKEVLSETPSAKPRPEPKAVANVAAPMEEKPTKEAVSADAAVSDHGTSCASLSLAADEVSEVATSSVPGPDRSPGKPARRRRPVSADLAHARRDRAAAGASHRVRWRSARGSPSPQRYVRRSPSPAAKRPSSEHRLVASPAATVQRKPPVPVRPSGSVSPRRAHAEAPPPAPVVAFPPGLSQPEDDAATVSSEVSVPNASVGGDLQGERGVDGEESLENPLVSLECFIFL